jgi:zinc/manganese transport system substrate-binding protein
MRTILNRCLGLTGVGLLGVAAIAGAGCGGDDDSVGSGSDGKPHIVVTTNILGDVVKQVVGNEADVDVIMPLGSDPHEFSPSARQAETMNDADLLVVNGAGFEEGLEEIIEQAEDAGTDTFSFADQIELIPFVAIPGNEEEAEEHTTDPHIWTDPDNIEAGVEALGDELGGLDGIDKAAVASRVADYVDQLTTLDADIQAQVANIPADRRVLVTNHEVFGYFAKRYGFEVVGTIIPGGTTLAEPSSAELENLRGVIESKHVPAIFAETTDSSRLADALAQDVGQVEVVTLYTESLGEEGSGAETYVGLMRTDAQLIADALGGS